MNKLDEKQFADTCADAVNIMGFDESSFCKQMSSRHRTLQQNFTRLCIKWLYHISKQEYDLRNEASVKMAQKVVETLGPFVYLPTV